MSIIPNDDEPQNWRELAEACLADMERYAGDETSARMMVSYKGYRERFELLAQATGPQERGHGVTEGSQPHTVDATGWRDISTAPKDTDFLAIIRADSGRTTMCVGCFLEDGFYVAGDDLSNAWTPTHWQPLPPPPGEEGASDEVVFDDGFNPFMDGYDVDPDGLQNQVPPFRASDIERGLILLRTSSNAHGYTNCVVLTDRIEKLPAKGRQELARMMRNIATEIDGPSPLQARYDELLEVVQPTLSKAAWSELKADVELSIDMGGEESFVASVSFLIDREKKIRSVVDGGE